MLVRNFIYKHYILYSGCLCCPYYCESEGASEEHRLPGALAGSAGQQSGGAVPLKGLGPLRLLHLLRTHKHWVDVLVHSLVNLVLEAAELISSGRGGVLHFRVLFRDELVWRRAHLLSGISFGDGYLCLRFRGLQKGLERLGTLGSCGTGSAGVLLFHRVVIELGGACSHS